MGSLQSELRRVGIPVFFKVECTEIERKMGSREHCDAMYLLEEREWEHEFAAARRKHPKLGLDVVLANMRPYPEPPSS